MNDNDKKTNNKGEERPIVVRNTTDLQRLKLEKLMKNPDKPVVIPERPKGRSMPTVPDFVRNVMGSSAGAGSGEFHVYRHLRRKEYARQKFIQEKSEKERLNDEYHQRIEDNKKLAEKKTAKKRAKRLKRKMKAKQNAKKPKIAQPEEESSEQSESESETEEKDTETTDNSTKEDDDVVIKQEHEQTQQKDTEESKTDDKSKELSCSTKDNDENESEDNDKIVEVPEKPVDDNKLTT